MRKRQCSRNLNKKQQRKNGDKDWEKQTYSQKQWWWWCNKKINNGDTIETLMMVVQQKLKNFNDVSLLSHNNHCNKMETKKLNWKGYKKTKSRRKREREFKNKRKKLTHKRERSPWWEQWNAMWSKRSQNPKP
jgi:hypothetical protein